MITQDLLDYIENEMAKNTPKQTIESNLVSNGWNAKDVAEGFAVILQRNSKPVPPPVSKPMTMTNPVANVNPISVKPAVSNADPVSPADHIDTNVDLDSGMQNSHQYAMPAQNLQEAVTQMMTPPVQAKKSSMLKITLIVVIILAVLSGVAFAYFKYFMPASATTQNTNTPMETAVQNVNFPPTIDNAINSSSTGQITSTSSTSTEENITLTGEEPEVFLGTTTATTSTNI